MRPVRTPETNLVYQLAGGNEDNDLFVCRERLGLVYSDWELERNERALLVAGGRIRLKIYSEPIPPVSLEIAWTTCRPCKTAMHLEGNLERGYRFSCPSCGAPAVPFAGEKVEVSRELLAQIRDLVAKGVTILDEQPPSPDRDLALADFQDMLCELLPLR